MKKIITSLLLFICLIIATIALAADYADHQKVDGLDAHGGSIAATTKILIQDPSDTDKLTTAGVSEVTKLDVDWDGLADGLESSVTIDATQIHDGGMSNTEFGYLSSVTGNVQTQLNALETASAVSEPTAGTYIDTTGTTVSVDITEMTGALTFNDGATDASQTWTVSLSGATDPVITFANNSLTVNVPLTGDGSGITNVDAYTGDSASSFFDTGTIEYEYGGLEADLSSTSGLVRIESGTTTSGVTTSANIAAAITDETGSGALVFGTSPTLVTPALGTPASGVITNLTGTASGATVGYTAAITTTDNESTDTTYPVLFSETVGSGATIESDGDFTYNPNSGTVVATEFSGGGSNLTSVDAATGDSASSFFDTGTIEYEYGGLEADLSSTSGLIRIENGTTTSGVTTSAGIAAAITDETGSGSLVFATSPTLVTPALGTPSALVLTNATGNASGATAGVATTVTIADNESTNEENAILFTPGGDQDGGDLTPESDGDFTYNPNSGTVVATEFSGGGSNLTSVDAATGDSATAFFDAGTIDIARLSLSDDQSGVTADSGTTTITPSGVSIEHIYVTADSEVDIQLAETNSAHADIIYIHNSGTTAFTMTDQSGVQEIGGDKIYFDGNKGIYQFVYDTDRYKLVSSSSVVYFDNINAKTATYSLSGVTGTTQLDDTNTPYTLADDEVAGTFILHDANETGEYVLPDCDPGSGYAGDNTVIQVCYSGVTVTVDSGTTYYFNGTATASGTDSGVTTSTVGEQIVCTPLYDAAATDWRWNIRTQDD